MVRRAYPVRTCVGCRKRTPASELLRVVAIDRGAGEFSIIGDPTRRQPGRGAHVHPDPACLVLAERRRAFGRALRVSGVVDTGPLAEVVYVAASGATAGGSSILRSHTDGGSTEPHPDKQGRTTDMGTR